MPTELLPATPSGAETANKQIYTGVAKITALGVFTNGVDDFEVAIYDGTDNTGVLLWKTKIVGADNYGGRVWLYPSGVNIGVYAEVTGSNGSYVVEYIRANT